MKLNILGVRLSCLLLLSGLVLPACGEESNAKKDDSSKEDDKKKKKRDKKAKADEEGDAKPASAKPDEADAKADADAKPDEGEAQAEGELDSDDAPSCGELNEVPTIPDTGSKPPTVEEWKTACKVNTQGPNSHPDDCEMKVMREWLRVTCRGDYFKTQNMENFGANGADYFEMIKPNQVIGYTMKLSKGRNQKVRICHTKNKRASLFVSWPSGEEKPLHIALARGPACD